MKLSVKENFFETIKRGGKPDSVVVQWGPLMANIPNVIEPCLIYMGGGREPGKTIIDNWGTTIIWPEGQPAAIPHHDEETKVIKDITRWREYVNVPDIVANTMNGWEKAAENSKRIRDEGNMTVAFMPGGMFERMHYLMGFEDALISFLAEPEACHELLDVICEFQCTYAKIIIEKFKPDAVLAHDDWGSKNSLFMSPDVWREFFKERYRKFYKLFKDTGILTIHHADSYLEPIVEDMVDIGIEIWQGVLPQNDIPKIQKILDGRMALMGGIDAAIVDVEDVPEDVIRAEVRRAITEYVPGGNFIPNLPNGLRDGALFPRTDQIIDDEIRKFNESGYFKIN